MTTFAAERIRSDPTAVPTDATSWCDAIPELIIVGLAPPVYHESLLSLRRDTRGTSLLSPPREMGVRQTWRRTPRRARVGHRG